MSDLRSVIEGIDGQLETVRKDSVFVDLLSSEDTEELHKFILIGIGPLNIAISIDSLAEIGPLPSVTSLPNLPIWIQGIVNLRSEIVSVVDFGEYLNLSGRVTCEGKRIAVLRHNQLKVGLRVDRIIGTVKKGDSEKQSLGTAGVTELDGTFFSSLFEVEENQYYILNVEKFLTSSSLVNFNQTV